MNTMNALKDEGFKLAIATGKSRRGLDRVLKKLELDDYFHASRCADETLSKPHPLMINELLVELDVPQREAVMIGDTEWDMKMADNAEVRKIAVSFGAHKPERLHACRPDLFVDDFSKILDWKF
jgi:phosphoglycolate phosphatase